ncbi:MAG: hypothetical protein ACRCUE_03680 [Bosea sp. (in: a-proteobacteria)]
MFVSIVFPRIAFRRAVNLQAPIKRLLAAALGTFTVLVMAPAGNAQPLPTETIACTVSGYSVARDRAGAPVRAEPKPAAKVLGRLAPPQKATGDDNVELAVADGVWRTEFQIIGFREGWFLIEKALHPYDDPNRRGVLGRRSTSGVKTYAGRGWINLNDVGGKLTYFHRSMPDGALYSEPRADATRLPASNSLGQPIRGGNSPKKVIGCNGEWVKATSDDEVIGWWKGLCGEPIGDCPKD